MTNNLNEKLSLLTTIPEKSLNKLSDLCGGIICDTIETSILNGESVADIITSIGILSVRFDNNELRFKFRPNAKFEEDIINTVVNKKNPLTTSIESTLVNRIVKTYKDLM